MRGKIARSAKAISTVATTEVVLRFDRQKRPIGSENDVIWRILAAGLVGGLVVGVLSVIVVHLLLLEFGYVAATRNLVAGGAIYSNLRVEGLATPTTVPQWGILAGCIVAAIAVHELGHLLALVVHRVRVHGLGVSLFLVVPVRFFTRIDRRDWRVVSARERAIVLSAGIATNHVVAIVALVLFAWLPSQVAGWLYASNVALALLSAVPLSNTDGDKLLSYVLHGDANASMDGPPKAHVYVLGIGSWLVVVGSGLTVALTTVAHIMFG